MSTYEETREILKLKQQLAEKDKEIENLNKEWVQSIHEWKEIVKKKDKQIAELEEHDMVFHNQLAVEQLEKVKAEMTYNGNGYCEVRQCSSPHTPNLNFAWFNYVVFNKFIDNQIKQLKGK